MEETIEENESASAPEKVADPHPSVPAKKRSVGKLLQEMWPAYLIEIIVIILGISITLALEEWRDSSKENQLEQIYLNNLLADIEVDLQSLNNAIAGTEKLLDRGNELLSYIRNPAAKEIAYGHVNADVRAILGRPKFIANDASFSDLKSSGNLHLLRDIQLKNLLFAYYSDAQKIKEIQDAELLATINISGAYFLKRFQLADTVSNPVSDGTESIAELLKSVEFDNNVLLRVSNRKELLTIYQRTDSLATELKNELVKKTSRPE